VWTGVNIVLGLLVTAAVTAATVAAMLLVRRHAPEGSYFADGDRAAGVFGVLATGFSVLLGFIVFMSFTTYDDARVGAESEATVVAQQLQTAQYLHGETSTELSGELVCYARSVAGVEWDALAAGTLGDSVNPWGARMYRTVSTYQPGSSTEQSAYDRWMAQTSDREQARMSRVHTEEGIIPLPLWLALFLICGVILVFLLLFADPAEGPRTQAVLIGSVTVVITLSMLLLVFFDHPHGSGLGRLEPTAMERTLRIMDAQLEAAGLQVTPPCDGRGVPR